MQQINSLLSCAVFVILVILVIAIIVAVIVVIISLISDRMLLRHVTGFYLAGTDTTSHNLYWNILYLLLNPDVTDKMYSEIQNKIGGFQIEIPRLLVLC